MSREGKVLGTCQVCTDSPALRAATLSYANIPQPLFLFPKGEGEQEFKVPLPQGEGFRVRANKGDILPRFSLSPFPLTLNIQFKIIFLIFEF
jgi:hypothetical protein